MRKYKLWLEYDTESLVVVVVVDLGSSQKKFTAKCNWKIGQPLMAVSSGRGGVGTSAVILKESITCDHCSRSLL